MKRLSNIIVMGPRIPEWERKTMRSQGWTECEIDKVSDALDKVHHCDCNYCSKGHYWCGNGDYEIYFYSNGFCEILRDFDPVVVKTENTARTIKNWNGVCVD